MKRGTGPGTNSRRVLDAGRLSKVVAAPGIDPRHWVSYGTVGTVDDKGVINYDDTHAIYIGPEGVEVDVILEPSMLPVTCHYAGLYGGQAVTIMAPIKPGDRVLVTLPEGDFSGPPVIVAVLHSAATPVPLNATQHPVFQNDRTMIYSKSVPVQVFADKIQLGDDTATEPFVLGNLWKTAMETILQALITHTHTSGVGPTGPPMPPEVVTLVQEKTALVTKLSTVTFGKL